MSSFEQRAMVLNPGFMGLKLTFPMGQLERFEAGNSPDLKMSRSVLDNVAVQTRQELTRAHRPSLF